MFGGVNFSGILNNVEAYNPNTNTWSTVASMFNSREALAEILGEDVNVASVPGGYFSTRVARAASAAGIRVLFTSEPTTRCYFVDECLVIGRYCLRSRTPAATAARLVRGDRSPRMSSWLSWNTRKVAKKVAGGLYLRARLSLLR